MIVSFEQEYFRELYEEEGKTSKKSIAFSLRLSGSTRVRLT